MEKGQTVWHGSSSELRAEPELQSRYLGSIADGNYEKSPETEAFLPTAPPIPAVRLNCTPGTAEPELWKGSCHPGTTPPCWRKAAASTRADRFC